MAQYDSIALKILQKQDLEDYYYWMHPSREFHKFNGPYYAQNTEEELKVYIEELKEKFNQGERDVLGNKKMIVDAKSGDLIGQVNWYWKSEETNWMEVGLVIFNENYWGQGIGYQALKLWIDDIFETFPQLIRIGLSTWSGNQRMMKLAEKMGLVKEAVYRKARIVEGRYYDSVSYGLLKEEWYECGI